jgi:integrase
VRLPVVFTVEEVRAILAKMGGIHHLMVSLLYGSGLRLTECLSLRIKDLDLGKTRILRLTSWYSSEAKGLRAKNSSW